MDPELEARIEAGLPARNPAEWAYYRRRRKGTSLIGDALVAAGSGPASFVTSMASGATGVARALLPNADPETGEGLDLEPEFLTRLQENLQERTEDLSRTGMAANAPIAVASRLGAEAVGYLSASKLLTSAGRLGNASRAAGLARYVAPNTLGRTGSTLLRRGRLAASLPQATLHSAGGVEGSTVAALSYADPNVERGEAIRETLEEHPALRVGSEIAVDLTLGIGMEAAGGVMGVIGRRLRRSGPDVDLDGGVRASEMEADAPTPMEIEGPQPNRSRLPEEQSAIDNLVAGGMNEEDAVETLSRGRGLPVEPRPTEVADEALESARPRTSRAGDLGFGEATPGTKATTRGVIKRSGYQVQFNKFGLDEAAGDAAEQTYFELLESGSIPAAVRKSNASTLAAAQEMGVGDLAKARLNKNLDEVMMTSLRINHEQNRQQIGAASRRISQALDDLSVDGRVVGEARVNLLDDIDAWERGMMRREQANEGYVRMFVRGASQAGRVLQSLKAMAQGNTDPFYWMLKARKMKHVVQFGAPQRSRNVLLPADRPPLPKLSDQEQAAFDQAIIAMQSGDDRAMEDVFRLINQGDRTNVGRLETVLSKGLDWTVQYRRAALLTGTKTFGRNMLSNAVESFLIEVPDRAIAVVADKYLAPRISGVRNVPVVRNQAGDVVGATGEAMRTTLWNPRQRIKASAKGARRGFEKAWRVLRQGEEWETGLEGGVQGDLVGRKMAEVTNGKGMDDIFMGGVMGKVFDVQGAYDVPFRYAAFWGSLDEQIELMTRHLPDNERLAARAAYELEPTEEMINLARMESLERVFANKTKLSEFLTTAENYFSGLRRSTDANDRAFGLMGQIGFGIVVPFRRTPSSILVRFAGERMPIASFYNIILKKRNLADAGKAVADLLAQNGELTAKEMGDLAMFQKKYVEAVGRAGTGLALTVGLGAWLASTDRFSGPYPKNDREEAERWRQQGKTPFSMRVGGHWFSLAGVAPLGNLLGLGAQGYLDIKEKGLGAGGVSTVMGAGSMFMEQSFMRGVQDLNKAINEGGSFTNGYLSNMAGSFVPTLLSDVAILSDGVLRERTGDTAAESMAYGALRRIPGASQLVPAQQDYLGDEIELDANAAVNPLVPRRIPTDPIGAHLVEEDLRFPTTRGVAGETTAEERTRSKAQGAQLKNAVSSLIRNATYRRLDHGQKQAALSALVGRVRRHMNANDQRGKSNWNSDIRTAINSARR